VAGRLGCTASLVGGESASNSRVHLGERERRSVAGGERGRRVLTKNGSGTKLRIIGRFDLLISQSFLNICVAQYIIVMVEVTTQEYDYNIFCIQYFLYRYIL